MVDVSVNTYAEAQFNSPTAGGKNQRSSELHKRFLSAWAVIAKVSGRLEFMAHC